MAPIKVEPHPFTYDDAPIESIIQAVAWVKGTEPEALDPLYDGINPDALESLLEADPGNSLTVTFSYEGCSVHINRKGSITVRERPESVVARLKRPGNVLLMEPPYEHSTDGFCTELRHIEPLDRDSVLQVEYAPSDVNKPSSRSPRSTTTGASHRITMGEFTRSASTKPTTHAINDHTQQTTIPDPGDLTTLGCQISEWLSAQEDAERQPAVCFPSISDLLQHVELRHAFRFLHIFSARIRAADGVAHFHLTVNSVDDETRATLEPLFDHVIEVSQEEDIDPGSK